MNICVYCSSSNHVEQVYFDAAEQLGTRLAERGDTLIYGGGAIGLMGAVSRAVHARDGHVVGVIPERLRIKEVAYENADDLFVTADMRTRKAVMEQRADAFITLPGGFGTLEELAETLTHQHLGYHNKPIVILNTHRFYDPLIAFFEEFYAARMAHPDKRSTYFVTADLEEALAYIDAYEPAPAAETHRLKL